VPSLPTRSGGKHARCEGYRLLAFDLLGYGRSERSLDRDTSVAAQARILERMLDFWGVEQADIVAHDIGGATAMIFAVNKPEQVGKLLLIDCPSRLRRTRNIALASVAVPTVERAPIRSWSTMIVVVRPSSTSTSGRASVGMKPCTTAL
jgi:pimeloyl-ACP methyl ester carboxylesterase